MKPAARGEKIDLLGGAAIQEAMYRVRVRWQDVAAGIVVHGPHVRGPGRSRG